MCVNRYSNVCVCVCVDTCMYKWVQHCLSVWIPTCISCVLIGIAMFVYVHTYTVYNTRYRNSFVEQRSKTTTGSLCLRDCLPKLVRETSSLVTDKVYTHSLHGFSTYTKNTFILASYKDNCEIQNCYVCNHQ